MPTERVIDYTEPEPLEPIEGIENPYEEPFLWHVELYLMSKYVSNLPINIGMEDATIFKVAAAAVEHAKIVKEYHTGINSEEELLNKIISDFGSYVQWTPKKTTRKGKRIEMRNTPTPGIRENYQRTL